MAMSVLCYLQSEIRAEKYWKVYRRSKKVSISITSRPLEYKYIYARSTEGRPWHSLEKPQKTLFPCEESWKQNCARTKSSLNEWAKDNIYPAASLPLCFPCPISGWHNPFFSVLGSQKSPRNFLPKYWKKRKSWRPMSEMRLKMIQEKKENFSATACFPPQPKGGRNNHVGVWMKRENKYRVLPLIFY